MLYASKDIECGIPQCQESQHTFWIVTFVIEWGSSVQNCSHALHRLVECSFLFAIKIQDNKHTDLIVPHLCDIRNHDQLKLVSILLKKASEVISLFG
jgi:hypothetical protein